MRNILRHEIYLTLNVHADLWYIFGKENNIDLYPPVLISFLDNLYIMKKIFNATMIVYFGKLLNATKV